MFCFWQNFSIRSSLSKSVSNLECIWVAFWLWNDDTTPLMHLTRPSPPSSSMDPRLMNLMPKLLSSPNVLPRSTCWPWWQKWTCLLLLVDGRGSERLARRELLSKHLGWAVGNISAEQSHQSDSEERQQLFLKLSEIGGKNSCFLNYLRLAEPMEPDGSEIKAGERN